MNYDEGLRESEYRLPSQNDFSIREEIRVQLEENLPDDDCNLDLTVDEVLDDIVNDDFMLTVITYVIYRSINALRPDNEVVEFCLNQSWDYVIKGLSAAGPEFNYVLGEGNKP